MSLAPPTKVGQLQETLHAKAKGSPNYRFYALYDKVYRADVLWHAYTKAPPVVVAEAPAADGERHHTPYPDNILHRELGLVQLRLRDRNVPWAKA